MSKGCPEAKLPVVYSIAMTDSVKRLEWEFKLDPSAVDSSEDVCKLIEFAKAAVEKKWKEEGDEYRKKLEEEKAVLCSDGYWRAELQELKQMENDIMLREFRGILCSIFCCCLTISVLQNN